MKYKLHPLKKYNIKFAQKKNYFRNFTLNDKIIIDSSLFGKDLKEVSIVYSNTEFKKAAITSADLIYFEPKQLLYYNQNGAEKKLGKGGVIAKFGPYSILSDYNFQFKSEAKKSWKKLKISISPSKLNEGDYFYISIKPKGIKPGTRLYYDLSGASYTDVNEDILSSITFDSDRQRTLVFETIEDKYADEMKNIHSSSFPIAVERICSQI